MDKIHVCITYKHTQLKINGSTSFVIDNMYYVSFRIYEKESIPWCSEIQNRRPKVLGKTFNLHSNSTWCPRCVVSQSVSKERIKSVQHSHKNTSFLMRTLMKRLNEKSHEKVLWKSVHFSPYIYNCLSNWASLLGFPNWALVCGLEWDQNGLIRH